MATIEAPGFLSGYTDSIKDDRPEDIDREEIVGPVGEQLFRIMAKQNFVYPTDSPQLLRVPEFRLVGLPAEQAVHEILGSYEETEPSLSDDEIPFLYNGGPNHRVMTKEAYELAQLLRHSGELSNLVPISEIDRISERQSQILQGIAIFLRENFTPPDDYLRP